MESKNICDNCPNTQPSSLVAALSCFDKSVHDALVGNIEEQTTPEAQLDRMLVFLTIVSLGGPDFRVQRRTAFVVTKCLKEIWNLGNRGMDCRSHPRGEQYKKSGRGSLCLRKYMMEESVRFLQKLWEESSENDEQFQALLRDGWPFHVLAFMC